MKNADDYAPLFTYAAMAAFIAVFAAQFKQFDLSILHSYPWRVADGELWRLITCTFLHGSLLHIVFNTALFVRFSSVIDNWLGPWVAMLFYAALASSASAAQLLVDSPVGLVGASGVVYGLFGFLWVVGRRRDDAADAANMYIAETLLGWAAICIVLGLMNIGNIGNTAHVWGLLLGWLTGQIVVARKRLRVPLILLTVFLWALPIALTYRPVWSRTLAYVPVLKYWYRHSPPPTMRERIEHPDELPRRPGFM